MSIIHYISLFGRFPGKLFTVLLNSIPHLTKRPCIFRMLSLLKKCKLVASPDRQLCLFLALALFLASLSEAMEIKRAGFVGMRGKKNTLDLLQDLYEKELIENEVAPKRSGSGFVGMRGKKSEQVDLEELLEEAENLMDKRAGFVGMRGKKSSSDAAPVKYQWPTFWSYNLPRSSRGSSSGFVGMRG